MRAPDGHVEWEKVAAMLLHRLESKHITLSAADATAVEGLYLVAESEGDTLHIRLVDRAEVERLVLEGDFLK